EALDDLQAALGTEDERDLGQRVRERRVRRDDRDADRRLGGPERARVEDVAVPLAVGDQERGVRARRRDRAFGRLEYAEQLALLIRVLDPDSPRGLAR